MLHHQTKDMCQPWHMCQLSLFTGRQEVNAIIAHHHSWLQLAWHEAPLFFYVFQLRVRANHWGVAPWRYERGDAYIPSPILVFRNLGVFTSLIFGHNEMLRSICLDPNTDTLFHSTLLPIAHAPRDRYVYIGGTF